MCQREPGGESMGVFGGGYDDGVKVVRAVEYTAKIGQFPGLRVALRRGIQGELINVAENRDILVGGRFFGGGAGFLRGATPRQESEFVQAGIRTTATGDERNV